MEKQKNSDNKAACDIALWVEWRSMILGLCEALLLRFLLKYLGYPSKQPIWPYCGNKAACDIAFNLFEVNKIFTKKLNEKIV